MFVGPHCRTGGRGSFVLIAGGQGDIDHAPNTWSMSKSRDWSHAYLLTNVVPLRVNATVRPARHRQIRAATGDRVYNNDLHP